MNPDVYNAQGRINRLSVLCIDAYGVAVKNGFKGTVEEWLASLKGESPTEEDLERAVAAYMEEHPNSGGNVDYVGVEPEEDDMPKVFLTGAEFSNMNTTKNEVKMDLEYISKTDRFKAAIKIKFQGNTSLTFPKKNFTIKMYTDDTYEDKLKKNFKDWNHSGNKYVLKANWIDHAHARNIISARLWGEVVASRMDYDSLPVEMRNAPNNGAIDGFPVKLYVNGNYEGVYTWNVGKDDWMWGMDEDNANHVLMCAETNNDGAITNTPCNFRALWSGTDENNWTVEVGTNSTAVKTALNNLIQFVMDNDGDAFRNGINNYLDIQSAIDYYIFQYEICGLDGLAKNMLLATYDGTRWICGAYDMDATFGLYWNGSKFVSAAYRCPEDYQETYSLLWERIEANFHEELKARQAELRKTVLSYSNIVTHFERFMDIIGLDLYAEDLAIYTGIPSGSTNNIKQIRNFIRDRQAYVDAEFATIGEGGEEEPDEPDVPGKTLTSISAIYSGGDAFVGTEVTALSGITVTAHYSDGTESVVTGYTLSGEIAEGDNTITVNYVGLTTTFTVTGKVRKIVVNNLVALSEVNDDTCDQASGAFNPDTAHNSSGFIPVKPGDNIEFNGVSAAYFDADKNYVSGIQYSGTVPKTKTVPDGVAFICFNYVANLKPYLIILPIKEADIAVGEELATSANIDTTGFYSEDGFHTNDTYGTLKPTNVSPGMVFTISNGDTAAFYSKDMVWVAGSNQLYSLTVPNQAVYMTVSFRKTNELSVIRTA
jgi:hypothetical protein